MLDAYLTIDDGPSDKTKEKIDFLRSKNIDAVLFCTGENISKYTEQAEYAIKNNYTIGNHSFSHPSFDKISTEACLEEINKTEKIIDIAYKNANITRTNRHFRYPYGVKGNALPNKKNQHFKPI
jgi:peptidoglycan/xylan/chitin deacetylase (PgdA/CDA1 family)